MSDALPLHSVVNVNSRFARSVSLVRDFESSSALDGYVLTPVGRDVLGRLDGALRAESTTRAWSLTGPYGSGKSAFALFVSQLLAGETSVRKRARAFLREHDKPLADSLFRSGAPLEKEGERLFPVLVTGSRQSLERALAKALAQALRRLSPHGRNPVVLDKLERLAESPVSSGDSVAALFEEADEYLRKRKDAPLGILLIIDELGKFLEYGASNPERGDVFVLQDLAEVASRSKRPFLVLTILHQAVDRYADHLSASRRSEWAKVQGRFEDIAFEEGTEQLLRLLSQAIRLEEQEPRAKPLRKHAAALASEAGGSGLRIGSLAGKELEGCLSACFPLHPLTSLIVGPLFRQLAQNERSLFAFLVSSEAFGFQDFLRSTTADAKKFPTYRLDQLYDYVTSALGPALLVHHRGKAWAEVEAALERLRDAPVLEVRLAKVIGLIQAVGPTCPVSASRANLHLALKGLASDKDVDSALENLQRKSISLYRRHLGGYVLWEGSDIDIESRLEEAKRQVNRDQPLAAFLTRTVPQPPMIARRHYFQKGTLRYFEVCYADVTTLGQELERTLGQADGRIVFCLPLNHEERVAMEGILKSSAGGVSASVVAALPKDVLDLGEYCHELLGLRWVLENTPELETDRTAKRELHSRLTHAEERLRAQLERVFTPQVSREVGCSWFVEGRGQTLASVREVNDLLSRICDRVYPFTPEWRNELINRRSLSSAAAAARGKLIEAMIVNPSVEALGFTGMPPERCMYETLLKGSRLHGQAGQTWGFCRPDGESEEAVRELWEAIDRFLTDTEPKKLPIGTLFETLRRPPFGLKDGVLPVIFAAALLYYDTEVALYESGTFVPRLDPTVFERMVKSPESFDVQRFRIVGPRYDVFKRYADLLNRATIVQTDQSPDLLELVKPLTRLIRDLPAYTTKTRQVSDTARDVYHAIRNARQPDRLLFEDIPKACGIEAIEPESHLSEATLARFFDVFRGALAELQRAYPTLLASIKHLILSALDKKGGLAEARRTLEHEARLVKHLSVDAKLKAFLETLFDLESDENTWLEAVATQLTNRAPSHWDDQDHARFEVHLASTARSFHHFRVLAFEMEKSGVTLLDGDPQMLRVSVTLPDTGDFERVVQVPPQFRSRADEVREKLRGVLDKEKLLDEREVSVAVLAQLVQQLIEESGSKKPARKGRTKA
jgi:hypothetical protein